MKKRIASLVMTLALCAGLLVVPAEAYDMGKAGESSLISRFGNHTAAIDANGSLWMWGYNHEGQLGIDGGNSRTKTGNPYQTVPVKVMDNVAAVNCGERHTATIDKNGALWMWGWNLYGQLGNGATEDETSLVPVKAMDNVAAVHCGELYTAAIQTDGSLWTWGRTPAIA